MRTVAISTALFDGYPIETAIEQIAASGARSLEPAYIKGYLDFDESAFSAANARHVATLIAGARLSVTGVSAHLDLALHNAAEMLRQRIRFAAALGARWLITNTGAASSRERILATIEAVLPDCEAEGVSLALENPGHGSGDLIGCGADGAALAAAIGSPHVRLNYDVGNIFTYNRGERLPEQDITDARDYIAHLHLKDIAADGQDWTFAAIGDGVINFEAIWRSVPDEVPVAIELPLRLNRPQRKDPVRGAQRLPLPILQLAMRRSLDFVARMET